MRGVVHGLWAPDLIPGLGSRFVRSSPPTLLAEGTSNHGRSALVQRTGTSEGFSQLCHLYF
jgi:hypothetical protein